MQNENIRRTRRPPTANSARTTSSDDDVCIKASTFFTTQENEIARTVQKVLACVKYKGNFPWMRVF